VSDGTFENPYANFTLAFLSLQTLNQEENNVIIAPGNVVNDIESTLQINFSLNVMAFGFASTANAIMNIKSEGSFLIYDELKLKNLQISIENSVQINAFIHLMQSASLILEV